MSDRFRTLLEFVLFMSVVVLGTELLFRVLRDNALPEEDSWMERPRLTGQAASPEKVALLMEQRAEMRVGRKLGRTLYLRSLGSNDWESDTCIGIVDTPEIAARIAQLWNEANR